MARSPFDLHPTTKHKSGRVTMQQTERSLMNRALTIIATVATLVAVSSTPAAAAGQSTAWSTKAMKTAIRGLAYPKPHPIKLACKGIGTATAGLHTSFRCSAIYRHHARRKFVIATHGSGGWLCAGRTLKTCRPLRRGFLTTAMATLKVGAAELAARGYMDNRYGTIDPISAGPCTQTGSSAWSCGYRLDAGTVTITIVVKSAKGGYIVTGSAST